MLLRTNSSDYPLNDSNDVANLLRASINKVLRGELDRGSANAIGFLSKILLEILGQGPFQERLAEMEVAIKAIAESQAIAGKEE